MSCFQVLTLCIPVSSKVRSTNRYWNVCPLQLLLPNEEAYSTVFLCIALTQSGAKQDSTTAGMCFCVC